jgi:hypothetical protein
VIEFVKHIKKVHKETKAALRQSVEMMKRNYNQKKGESQEYKPGDKVWLEGTKRTTDRPRSLTTSNTVPSLLIRKSENHLIISNSP